MLGLSRREMTGLGSLRGLGFDSINPVDWMPPITTDLTYNHPFRKNAKTIVNDARFAAQALNNQSTDAVGTFDHARTRSITGVQANILRIEAKGARIEATRTNKVIHARKYDTTWLLRNGLTIAQDETGIDGVANTAWTLTDDSASTESLRLPNGPTIPDDSTTWCASFLVKKDSNTSRFPQFGVILEGGDVVKSLYRLNTVTGALFDNGSTGNVFAYVDAVRLGGIDWWYVVLGTANNGTGNFVFRIEIIPAHAATIGGAQDASLTGSIVMDAVQFENGNFPTSFIPTTAVAVTRAADDARHATAGNILPAAGSFSFAVTTDFDGSDLAADAYAFDFSDGSDGIRGFFDSANAGKFTIEILSGGGVVATLVAVNAPVRLKTVVYGIAWDGTGFRIYADGVEDDTAVGDVPLAVNADVYYGQNRSGANHLFGNIAHTLAYSRALSATAFKILAGRTRQWMGL